MKNKIHYFTNIAPHYRQRLWEILVEDRELDFHFYFDKTSKGGIKEMNFDNEVWQEHKHHLHQVRNLKVFGIVIWQHGVLRCIYKMDIKKAIYLWDKNIIPSWLAVAWCRRKGVEICFWGHGFTGNESILKKNARILFNRLAHNHFLYGKRAKNLMVRYGFNKDCLHVVYNSLDYDEHKKIRSKVINDNFIKELFQNSELPTIVFIGRLTQVKKLDLLIEAVNSLNDKSPEFNLLIIGDGEMKESLVDMAESLLDMGTYNFYGACYIEEEIGKMLANADLCVSPGNVGLTAIHSLSFGTPVCTHNNFENQMPEYEVVEPGVTGFFFKENDANSLAECIKKWFSEAESREKIRTNCYNIIDEKYNPYQQRNIFKQVLTEQSNLN